MPMSSTFKGGSTALDYMLVYIMKKSQLKQQTFKPEIQSSSFAPPQQQKSAAPHQKEALDLHLILGDDTSGEQLAKLNLCFQLKPEKIQQLCTNADLDYSTVGSDTILRFDFVTQEGREKEAIQYFQNGLDRYPRDQYDPNLSPLQNWFTRPTHQGKLQLFESKRIDGKKGITLLYRIYTSETQDMEDLRKLVATIKEKEFNPDATLQMELRGHLDTYKKNRIRIRMDHIRAHLFSKEFKLAQLLKLMQALQIFGEDQGTIRSVTQNPLFKLLMKSQEIHGTVKMASLRKMLELYKIGVQSSSYNNKTTQKESPQVIKGLFKGEVRFTLVYESKLGLAANIHYESQSVLIRLLSGLKKYAGLFD